MDYVRGHGPEARARRARAPAPSTSPLQYAVAGGRGAGRGARRRGHPPRPQAVQPAGHARGARRPRRLRHRQAAQPTPRDGDVLTSASEVLGTPRLPVAGAARARARRRAQRRLGARLRALRDGSSGEPPFGRGGSATTAAILRDEPEFPPSVPARSCTSSARACARAPSRAWPRRASCSCLLRDAHDRRRGRHGSRAHRVADAARRRPSVRRARRRRASSPPPARRPNLAPSSMPPSRAPSSAMRVAVARGRIKGTAVRAGIAWFAETLRRARARSASLELASPELRADAAAPDDPAFGLIASGWYDTLLVGELLGLLERVASPGRLGGLRQPRWPRPSRRTTWAASIARSSGSIASPPLLEANAQRVWRTYVDEGTLSGAACAARASFEARVRGWSRHHPDVCRMLRAMIESLAPRDRIHGAGRRAHAVRRPRRSVLRVRGDLGASDAEPPGGLSRSARSLAPRRRPPRSRSTRATVSRGRSAACGPSCT